MTKTDDDMGEPTLARLFEELAARREDVSERRDEYLSGFTTEVRGGLSTLRARGVMAVANAQRLRTATPRLFAGSIPCI